ncbi:MAG: TolC family protein, partial [Chitinophagaceae bacterium]|nr:TolC family protein [Chitinophagaceae bacterium]
MFLKFRGYLSAGLLFLFLGASGQTSIGLSQILHMLQQNAPSLVSDSMVTHVFQQKLEATRYSWWPNLRANLQAGIGTNNNLPGGFFSNGLVPSNSKVREVGRSNTILTDLGVLSFDWEIYNFGAYDARNRVASSDLQVQKLNYEQRKYQLQKVGIDVYLSMVLMKELVGIQDQSIERNSDIKRIIRALAISGIKAGVDTSIADAELSSARLVKLDLVKQFNQ